ncbi:hypothetical protein RJT34_07701 [Clitoria ternatea]|uniref:Uncharacterized protein n=1 Tax=Clitoria ternatea TaxID=43366 RepID=A0AAN9K3P9_CLITE
MVLGFSFKLKIVRRAQSIVFLLLCLQIRELISSFGNNLRFSPISVQVDVCICMSRRTSKRHDSLLFYSLLLEFLHGSTTYTLKLHKMVVINCTMVNSGQISTKALLDAS